MNCKDKKHCSKCGVEKPLGEFHKNPSTKDGRQSRCKSCRKKHYQASRERILEQKREYYQANKDHILERHRKYHKERRASDPIFALACRCRRRIQQALKRKGFSKDSTTAEMLGCTYDELMQHLESLFTDGMSWDNMRDWHIDHIVPLASANTKEETIALNHYTNLQPLWAGDNLSKGARLDWAA